MKKQLLMKLAMAILMLQTVSCIWIQVQEDVDYPEKDFKKAYQLVEEMMDDNPERDGVAEHIHIMVYDGQSRDYVNLIIPLYLIEAGQSMVPMDEIKTHGPAGDIDIHELLNNVWDMGPGLIIQVDEVESDTTVLIWLE